jgi:peptidoglycan hydrolase-like protein with peptidoglycan-binding domain
VLSAPFIQLRTVYSALQQDIPSVTVDGIVGPVTWQALVSGLFF